MKGYCSKHKYEYDILISNGCYSTECPICKEEKKNKYEVLDGLNEIAEHFRMVQKTQKEAGKYVSANFKRYEKICLDAAKMLSGQ